MQIGIQGFFALSILSDLADMHQVDLYSDRADTISSGFISHNCAVNYISKGCLRTHHGGKTFDKRKGGQKTPGDIRKGDTACRMYNIPMPVEGNLIRGSFLSGTAPV